MYVPYGSLPILIVLCCALHANARISPKVITLQQGLYGELQALERGALVTTSSHSLPEGSAFTMLRKVFHEFERQNQESITAILRVLALVDHTLENTIKDCAKMFDLPSLESENILFRDVTRPLLVQIAHLCEHISSEEFTELENSMEAVAEEANRYRKRLDATQEDMRTVLKHLNQLTNTISMNTLLQATLQRMNHRGTGIEKTIMDALQTIAHRQNAIGDSFDEIIAENSYESDNALLLTNFVEAIGNETNLLADGLSEQLQTWNNDTEEVIRMIVSEVETVFHNLIESPVNAFLEHENSLKCLADYYKNVAARDVVAGLKNIFVCFNGDDTLSNPLETITRLLELTENDVEFISDGLLKCLRSDDTHLPARIEVISCFEVAETLLDEVEKFVEEKTNEIFFHLEDAISFEQLKIDACLYYKTRKLTMDLEYMNWQYRRCNGKEEFSDNNESISV